MSKENTLDTKSPSPIKLGEITYIYLYEDITDKSVNRIINEINLNINSPIILRIKTNGGSVYDTLALVDYIHQHNIGVHADGYAFSGGFILLCASNNRSASNNAQLMYHDMSYGIYGKREDHKNDLKHSDTLRDTIHKIITKNTKITKKKLQSIDKGIREWYLSNEDIEKFNITNAELLAEAVKKDTISVEYGVYKKEDKKIK